MRGLTAGGTRKSVLMGAMHLLPPTGPALAPADLFDLYRTDPGRRLVRMGFVSSIDGAVEIGGVSGGLGTDADRQVLMTLRTLADGVMVGAGTLRDEDYRPIRLSAERRDWRHAAGLPTYPRLIVVSGRLDLDPGHRAFADAPIRPVVITHAAADDERCDAIAEVADVIVHGVDRVDLIAAVGELRSAYGIDHILCEGGPALFGSLHAAGLVDEVCLTLSPLLAGPGAGRIIAGPPGAVTAMTLRHAIAADGALLLRYARP
jgi:riboflavin biosynthesis pyrimidine reductase